MSDALMAPRKKRNEFSQAIAKSILENYQPKTVAEMQNALKDIFGPMFEAMLQGNCLSTVLYDLQRSMQVDLLCIKHNVQIYLVADS